MAKYVEIDSTGDQQEVAFATSGGAGDAGKAAQLDENGRWTNAMMPTGIGADSVQAVASEALAAGDFVNIYDNGGVPTCRKADASVAGKRASGYVTAAVASAATATIFFDDSNPQVTGKTPGAAQFLSATTPGQTTEVKPAAPAICQLVGIATSATNIHVKLGAVTKQV